MGTRPSTVFIGPIEVAGFCAALASGFREIGWIAHSVDVGAHRFGYGGGESRSRFLTLVQSGFRFLASIERRLGRGGRLVLYPFRAPLMGMVFVWAVFSCENFLYVFGQSLLPWNIDLWLLRKLRRPVLHVYLGSDSRPPFLSGKCLADNCRLTRTSLADLAVRRSRRLRARLRRIYAWSSYVIDNPMSGLLQPGSYINWFSLGFPTIVDGIPASEGGEHHHGEMVVVHAPSALIWLGRRAEDAGPYPAVEYVGRDVDHTRHFGGCEGFLTHVCKLHGE